MDLNLARRKTAMILHEIEKSLGDYILNKEITLDNFPDEIVKNVIKRESERNSSLNFKKPQDIVESTYLDEIFNIILEISKDTSSSQYLSLLKEKFVMYGIYEIRNVISHPNRKFIDTYWYRAAAIASDPIVDILGLDSVKRSLASAEEGELIDPPEEWINKIIWEIPNNLPNSFEHAITGLVGRGKEEAELFKLMQNMRVNNIAIVAQGGIGKTALVLDFLSNKVKEPETKKYIDSCIFATLKNEKLTHEGIKKLDAIESLHELKKLISEEATHVYGEVFDCFNDLCVKKKDEKVLLFIDNLETLLIHSEKEFQEFNYSLPQNWRVLVTSRVPINNSSIISLEPLKEKSAIHLARVYLSRKNHSPLDDTVLVDLVRKCFYNPLAIRLTIDLYSSGREIPASINVANKEITAFSFSNLIDSLTDNAIGIIEALFITNNLDRTTLCELLSLTIEELSGGISQLSNTSLISRKTTDSGEIYVLNDSIRELLITNPRNILLRDKIQGDMKKRKAISKQIEQEQIRYSLPMYHWDYIPKEINENLKIILTEVNRSFKGMSISRTKAIELMKKFRVAEHLYENIPIFNRTYARLLSALNASELAIEKYKKAISQNVDDVNAKIFLAIHYHNSGSYNLSYQIYKELIDDGWTDESKYSNEFINRIVNGFYFSLLYDFAYEDIIHHSKEWKGLKSSRGIVGVFRATALKRLAEGIVDVDSDKCISYLQRSMRTLNDVIRNDGYIKPACEQAKNIMNETAFYLRRENFRQNDEFSNEVLGFIVEHLTKITSVTEFSETDEVILLVKKLDKAKMESNPFSRIYVKGLLKSKNYEFVDSDDLANKELIVVKVSNIPKKKESYSPYIFALADGMSYFLHCDFLQNGDREMWENISVGDSLAVKPNDIAPQKPGKARDVLEIYLMD